MLQVHALRLKLALEGGDVVQTGRVIFFGEHHRAPSGRLPHRLVHYLRAQIEQLERVVMVRPAVGRLREFGLDGRRNAFGQSSLLELGDTLLRVQVGVDCTFQHKGLTGGIRLRSIRLKLGDVEGELVRERLKRKHEAGHLNRFVGRGDALELLLLNPRLLCSLYQALEKGNCLRLISRVAAFPPLILHLGSHHYVGRDHGISAEDLLAVELIGVAKCGLKNRDDGLGKSCHRLELYDASLRADVGVDRALQLKSLAGGVGVGGRARLKIGHIERQLVGQRLQRPHIARLPGGERQSGVE
eukprot:scaffold12181_cov213-Isochrysis_galbana.AAC.7